MWLSMGGRGGERWIDGDGEELLSRCVVDKGSRRLIRLTRYMCDIPIPTSHNFKFTLPWQQLQGPLI